MKLTLGQNQCKREAITGEHFCVQHGSIVYPLFDKMTKDQITKWFHDNTVSSNYLPGRSCGGGLGSIVDYICGRKTKSKRIWKSNTHDQRIFKKNRTFVSRGEGSKIDYQAGALSHSAVVKKKN